MALSGWRLQTQIINLRQCWYHALLPCQLNDDYLNTTFSTASFDQKVDSPSTNWTSEVSTFHKLNKQSIQQLSNEQFSNWTMVQFNIQHLPIEQIDIYQNCLILCSIDICWIDIDSIDICSIDMCPRMGASPQTPWLCGASAPLRSPPGGAWEHCWYPP